MIQQPINRAVQHLGNAPTEQTQYHIDPSAVGNITAILRNMYSDPLLAVVREYVTNAIDAHTEARILDKAIDIHIPTQEEAWFSVRDYGKGLNKEQTNKLLYGYGASGEHKQVSNEYIGGFGIGCKCAFALTDAFTYTIRHQGTVCSYSCFLNDHDEGQANLVHEATTEEPSGVEVKIPITLSYDTTSNIINKLKEVLTFAPGTFNIFPEAKKITVTRPTPILSVQASCDIEGQKYPITYRFYNEAQLQGVNTFPALLLGPSLFSIDSSQIPALKPYKIPSYAYGSSQKQTQLRKLINKLVIEAPIGFVQVAPSREQLQYSGMTKKVLDNLFQTFLGDDFQKWLYNIAMANAETDGNMLSRRRRATLLGLEQKEEGANSLGFIIPRDEIKGYFKTRIVGANYHTAIIRSAYTTWVPPILWDSKKHEGDLILSDSFLNPTQSITGTLVLATSEECKSQEAAITIAKRAVTKFPTYQNDIRILVGANVKKIRWLADKSIIPVLVKDLPEVDEALFSKRTTRTTVPRKKTVSLGTKFLMLRSSPRSSVNNSNGAWWDKVLLKDMKERTKRIVYVTIARGRYIKQPTGTRTNLLPDSFSEFVKLVQTNGACRAILPELDQVFGLREKDYETREKIKKDKKYITLEDYLKERFEYSIHNLHLDLEQLIIRAMFRDIRWFRTGEHCLRDLLKLPEFNTRKGIAQILAWDRLAEQEEANALSNETAWLMVWQALGFTSYGMRRNTLHTRQYLAVMKSKICTNPENPDPGKHKYVPMFDFTKGKGGADMVRWWKKQDVGGEDPANNNAWLSRKVQNPFKDKIYELIEEIPLVMLASDVNMLHDGTDHPLIGSTYTKLHSSILTTLLKDAKLRKHLAARVGRKVQPK